MPNAKITKESVINAGISLIRQNKEISARNVAKMIGCSTQPIYCVFKDMEELKKEVFNAVYSVYKAKIKEYASEASTDYKALGVAFIKFAREERELFGYAYIKNYKNLPEDLKESGIKESAELMAALYGLKYRDAYKFHSDMLIYTYGLAVMQYLGQDISDEEISERLTAQFTALAKAYGVEVKK